MRHEKTSADQNPKDQVIDAAQALKTFLRMHAQLLQMARSTNAKRRIPQEVMGAVTAADSRVGPWGRDTKDRRPGPPPLVNS